MLRLCGAKAKQNGHKPCRQPAMENGRCRLHGGKTPKHGCGAKTPEGKMRQKMARWKNGLYSAEVLEERRKFRQIVHESKEFLVVV